MESMSNRVNAPEGLVVSGRGPGGGFPDLI